MKLTCPACGAVASAEAWVNDASCRQFMDELTRLPGPVQVRTLPYIALFRKSKRGLSWPRALRIIKTLSELVHEGTVQWDGGELRPAPPYLWAEAMDRTIDRSPKALENHNYLRKIAWEMAEKLAAKAEREREQQKMNRAYIEREPEKVSQVLREFLKEKK